MKHTDDSPQYYTGEGVNVTSRLKDGKTKFFEHLKDAEAYADSRNSYKYEMFNGPTGGRRELIGYGVPQ